MRTVLTAPSGSPRRRLSGSQAAVEAPRDLSLEERWFLCVFNGPGCPLLSNVAPP